MDFGMSRIADAHDCLVAALRAMGPLSVGN
jgi:hypothetical protein